MNDFLFRHVEKFIFTVLVLLAVFLVYRGFQMPDYLTVQQPDRMEQGANEVRTSIDADHWEAIAEPRLETIDVVARTNESIRPVDPQVYGIIPWEGKSIDMSVKREDPVIAAPIDLRVTPVLANLAYKSANSEYPLTELENAEPIEKAPEQPERRPRGRGRQNMEMMSSDPYAMGMESSYGMESSAMAGSGSMMPGATSMTASRRIDPKLYDQGFRPQGNPQNLVPAMGQFIAGVALMPHKKLHQAFEDALKSAEGYNPRRDQPVYLLFEVYRADVTDKAVDQLTDQDWTLIANSEFYKRLVIRLWAGMAKEIVTGKYRDPALTTPIPPVLLDHYGRFASHPEIPLGDEDPRIALQQMAQQQALPTGPITFDAEEDPFANRGRIDPLRNLPPGMSGMGSGAGLGYGSMPGMGYGMSGMGQYGAVSVADQPDYKLIRFYDFYNAGSRTSPQPGRKYVYRIRTAIEDPNFPEDPAAQPRNSTLSAEVYRRVMQATARATETKRRVSRRWSEFSEPSPIVSLPSTTAVFAGPVTPASTRKMQVDGREIDYVQKPASGKLVAAQWDRTYQVPVPIFTEVLRGSVIAKQGDFDVPDPLTFIVKKLPEADYNTQTVVVDITGGNPLEISPAENQTAPGVMLLFDPNGGLKVSDEVETQRDYRLYSYADDRGE
jgi:hypothetical protein